MAERNILARLTESVFFLDGAMGTELIARGFDPMKCSDYQNIEAPEIVESVHRAYLDAGCNGVITNTFGANSITLKRHGHEKQAEQVNQAGAEIARRVAGPDRYVIGDIGPCGDFLEPVGTISRAALFESFMEQARGLAHGGADAFIIETMTALDEIKVAFEAVRAVSELPVFASLAYDQAGDQMRTMMGVSPNQAVEELIKTGISAIGFNCGSLSMDKYLELAKQYIAEMQKGSVYLLAEPNAGMPELVDGKAVYSLSPEDFAEELNRIHQAGAMIVGGCCGTSPAHIAAAVKKIRG